MHLLAKRGIHTLAVDLRGTSEMAVVVFFMFFQPGNKGFTCVNQI